MNLDEFKSSIAENNMPSGLSPTLEALWHEARGDWEAAHRLVQDVDTKDAAWIHAYLHRKEGDTSNAGYWYSRAGRRVSHATLSEEWDEIVRTMLAQDHDGDAQTPRA